MELQSLIGLAQPFAAYIIILVYHSAKRTLCTPGEERPNPNEFKDFENLFEWSLF